MGAVSRSFVVNINDLTKGVSQQGFGLIVILDNSKDIPYTLISSPAELKSLDVEIDEEDRLYKIAEKIFMQKPTPRSVAIFGKEGSAVEGVNELVNQGENDWFSLVCTDNSDETIIGLSKWATANDRIYYSTTQNLDIYEDFEYPNGMIGYHNDADDLIAEGLAGHLSMRPPGSTIPKFREIVGSKPAKINDTELKKLHENGGFTCLREKGINHVSESKTTDGSYLDIILGGYFVKFRAEEALFLLAVTTDKIGYTNPDIQTMTGTVRSVLNKAVDNNIILSDYDLTSLKREEMPKNDRANRDYSGIKAKCNVVGAVQTGEVNIDFVS